MTTYENAPATLMLATHCLACARPLVDANSVEAGMGPDCREKYGYNVAASDEARTEANKLVHALAAADTEPSTADIASACVRLMELGFLRLSAKIAERFAAVEIAEQGTVLSVAFGYSPEAVAAIKTVPGRRFDSATKSWTVPATSRRALWGILRNLFPGQLGVGPKGPFLI